MYLTCVEKNTVELLQAPGLGLREAGVAYVKSFLKMLPSVAGVDITACMFDPAPLWLCVVITAYVLN